MARESAVTRDDNYFAGDDRVFRWTVFDSDDLSAAVALDITGYTLDWELKLNESDILPLITRSGFSPSDAANGLIEVTLLDTETETLIQRGIHVLREGKTALVIAHRLSTIQDVDRIYVLHRGSIVESGPHEELLALGGVYQRLYRLQYGVREPASAAAG